VVVLKCSRHVSGDQARILKPVVRELRSTNGYSARGKSANATHLRHGAHPAGCVFHTDGTSRRRPGIKRRSPPQRAVNKGSRARRSGRRQRVFYISKDGHTAFANLPAGTPTSSIIGAHRPGAREAEGRDTRRRAGSLTGRDASMQPPRRGLAARARVLPEARSAPRLPRDPLLRLWDVRVLTV